MDLFSKNTTPTGDALASLAIVRSLLKVLRESGAINDPAMNFIMTDAHEQLAGGVSAAFVDARGLISDMRETVMGLGPK